MAWALYEWRGRYRPELPSIVDQLAERDAVSSGSVLPGEASLAIAGLLASGINECFRVRVTDADIPMIRVMGADPLTNFSRKKLAEIDTDGSADFVRRLVVGPGRSSTRYSMTWSARSSTD